MRRLSIATALTMLSGSALAHGPEFHDFDPLWTFDPWILVPLAMAAGAYMIGFLRISGVRGAGRRVIPALLYLVGWAALAGALVSPLHWLGEHLFSFHMVEHEIIMAVAAPLLVLARPAGVLLWSLPRTFRLTVGRTLRTGLVQTVWSRLASPGIATLLHGIAIWMWHVPPLFDAALAHETLHRLQHLSFFATALLFWWALIVRAASGVAVWQLFVTMLHTGVLGALMALAPVVLYRTQTADALSWGLTPLEDQQLAGLLMWVPAGTVYAGAALAFAALWIARSGSMQGGTRVPSPP